MRNRFWTLPVAALLVLSACSPSATPPPANGASPSLAPPSGGQPSASAPLSAVKEGGTLVVALSGDIASADPALSDDTNVFYVADQTVQGLLGLKPGTISDVIPVLATTLPTQSADGLTYTFTLRTGVTFSDGTPFNSTAVKYNYERQANLPAALQSLDYYYGTVFGGYGAASNIKSIDTPDPQTVVFHLGHPQSNFLIAQTVASFGIQSPTALKAGDADNPDSSKSAYYTGQGMGFVGTGPFMFKEWVPNDHVTLVKNPNYWDAANAAHLDSVIFKPYPDQTAEMNALQAGDIDLAVLIAPALVSAVKADPTLQVINRGQACNSGQITINQSHPPMDNKDIRFAIAYAINKPSYVKAFYGGLAEVADNWMPLGVEDAIPLNLPTYDPAKAKDLIAQSGLTGDQLTIDFYYPSDATRTYMPDPKGLFQAISRDLTAVGFKVVPHTEGWRTGYLTDLVAGKFPASISGWTCDWGGPDNFLQAWLFNFVDGKPFSEFDYNNPQLADIMNQAVAATDPNAAKALWVQAQQDDCRRHADGSAR